MSSYHNDPSRRGRTDLAATSNSSLKVLHVIPSIAACYGGPSTAILPMVRAINESKNVSAEIATTDANGPKKRLMRQKYAGTPTIHFFRRNFSERWKVSWQMQRWLREMAGSYDVLHLHALWSFSTAAAARAADLQGVPYIVRPAGMLSAYTWSRSSRTKHFYYHVVESRTIQNASAFHVTSEAEAEEVRALRADAKVFNVPNGVDEVAFSEVAQPCVLRNRCGSIAGQLPIILFLSRLHPKKGIIDRLLPAVAAMKTPCFLAIAGGEDSHAPAYADAILQAVKTLGLQDRVALLGSISADERWALYDGADLFVLPSHAENFGIVVAEAMARGCPVAISDAVQSCTHVKASGAGKIVSGDSAAWADVVDRLLIDSHARTCMGEAGRHYAQQHFRWHSIAQGIHGMYRAVLPKSSATPV